MSELLLKLVERQSQARYAVRELIENEGAEVLQVCITPAVVTLTLRPPPGGIPGPAPVTITEILADGARREALVSEYLGCTCRWEGI